MWWLENWNSQAGLGRAKKTNKGAKGRGKRMDKRSAHHTVTGEGMSCDRPRGLRASERLGGVGWVGLSWVGVASGVVWG